MDEVKAQSLFNQIKGKKIKEISIVKLIDNGKSAAVFCGEKDGKPYAVKIFDTEIIKKYGNEIQQDRINLELSLKEHKINNLVKIIDGGTTTIENNNFFFIIMEYIEGKNLKKFIKEETITIEFIVNVMNILINVTEELLKNDPPMVHRDIKPENIMVTDTNDIILMDLGVIKIIGKPSMTDMDTKQFLGTLRYAPPEFLTREEVDNKDGWQAVNIYQIGAVLHDLIMKKELFDGIEPYTNLVIAIKDDMPRIISKEYHPKLIQLARNMLQKDWGNRLRQNPIDKLKSTLNECLLSQEEDKNYYNVIKTNALDIQAELADIEKISKNKAEKERMTLETHYGIWNIIDECFKGEEINEIIKKYESSIPFKLDMMPDTIPLMRYRFYKINGKFEYGYAKPFLILFKLENNESSYCKLEFIGIKPEPYLITDLDDPERLMYIFFRKAKSNPKREELITGPPELNIPLCAIFEGIVEFDDIRLKNIINQYIGLMMNKVAENMRSEIKGELEMRKKALNIENKVGIFTGISCGNFFIEI